jgi:hypothetical protein
MIGLEPFSKKKKVVFNKKTRYLEKTSLSNNENQQKYLLKKTFSQITR